MQDVRIADYYILEKTNGKDVLVVDYEWTNTADSKQMFSIACVDRAYQNGLELSQHYGVLEGQSDYVLPGATHTVSAGYYIGDRGSGVELIVSEFLGEDVLHERIAISDADVRSEATTRIEITGMSLSKDYDGTDVLVVSYVFYNDGDDGATYAYKYSDTVYQNGVERPKATYCDDVDSSLAYKEVRPGYSAAFSKGYKVDLSLDAEIIVSGWAFDKREYYHDIIDLSGL